jgi:hypothetical protein
MSLLFRLASIISGLRCLRNKEAASGSKLTHQVHFFTSPMCNNLINGRGVLPLPPTRDVSNEPHYLRHSDGKPRWGRLTNH